MRKGEIWKIVSQGVYGTRGSLEGLRENIWHREELFCRLVVVGGE